MMRTRNFRVRSEVLERGSVTKSQKGKKGYVESKVWECVEWKVHGQCSKGGSWSFSHDKLVQGDLRGGQRREGRLSSPAPDSKAKTDQGWEKILKQIFGINEDISSNQRRELPCRCKVLKSRQVKFGIRPCVKTTSLSPDVFMEENVSFRHVEAEERPSKKSKKSGAKGSVALLKESTQLGCVSQDSCPRKIFSTWKGEIGIKRRRQIFQGRLAPLKNSGKKGSIARNYPKEWPHHRSPCEPKFGERSPGIKKFGQERVHP